ILSFMKIPDVVMLAVTKSNIYDTISKILKEIVPEPLSKESTWSIAYAHRVHCRLVVKGKIDGKKVDISQCLESIRKWPFMSSTYVFSEVDPKEIIKLLSTELEDKNLV